MKIQNPLFLKKLERTGFTDKEALVYLALLELGGAFPSKIADYTGLNRTTVYKILLNLSIRGLVNEIEKKKKLFYQIERPDRFIKYTESRVRQAEDSLEAARLILPEIKELHGQLGQKPTVTYYEGTAGIVAIYEDHLASKEPYEMLAWADTSELRDFLPASFFDTYVRTKEKIGITTRGIVPDTNNDRSFNDIRYTGIRKEIWPNMRFAPSKDFPMTGEVVIYGKNKVSIVNLSKDNAVGTIIEDANIYKMMVAIFNLSWEASVLRM
jgi:sugar-specific transcriptional regulator TrmB